MVTHGLVRDVMSGYTRDSVRRCAPRPVVTKPREYFTAPQQRTREGTAIVRTCHTTTEKANRLSDIRGATVSSSRAVAGMSSPASGSMSDRTTLRKMR
jgi:hypothetical protein